MKKILITTPNSIAGSLILKGFCAGFKSNGCRLLEKDLRELKIEDIKRFKPDIIFGYDYGFLFSNDTELKTFIKEYAAENGCKLLHYFADEPDGKYAYVDKPELFKEFKELIAKGKLNIAPFVWDREFTKQLEGAEYLPLAVNYKAYRPTENTKYEISFVGRPLTDKRQKILAALIKTFGKKLSIFSYEKHFLQSLDDMRDKQFLSEEELDIYKSSYKGFLKTEKEIADVYYNSKININITLQGSSGLNYRVFEALASRAFLITDRMGDIEHNFIVSKELEVYDDVEDLIDKIRFYLKNQNIAQRIAIIGFADVIKSHGYTARARKILDSVKD